MCEKLFVTVGVADEDAVDDTHAETNCDTDDVSDPPIKEEVSIGVELGGTVPVLPILTEPLIVFVPEPVPEND